MSKFNLYKKVNDSWNLKHLKIGKKLGISFIIVLTVAALANVYALSNLRKAGKLSNDLFVGPYELTDEAMGIRRDVVSIGQFVSNAIISDNPTQFEALVMKDFDSIYERIKLIENNPIVDDEIKELIKTIDESVAKLRQEYEKLYSYITRGDIERARAIIVNQESDYMKAYANSGFGAIALYEAAQNHGIEFNEKVKSTVSVAWIISMVVSIVAIGLGVVICSTVTRQLRKPIEELEKCANKMAKGNFDIDIEYDGKDELGVLANSMRQVSNTTKEVINDAVYVLEEISMGNFDVSTNVEYIGVFKSIENSIIKITKDLSDTMTLINAASEEVGSAAEQVASGSQMLSQGATEQASAIEELSATINDISDKVKETANNAGQARVLTLNAGNEVEDGNNQMMNVVKAMQEISTTSNEISRIIKTIDDIAFQTNILALNAAVEAARAGEAGKGFAVVADEVRNLAGKSADAAKNTATLIENSIKAVDNGSKMVDDTALSLQKIINTMYESIVIVEEIARSSEEQASAISQVTLGVEQISHVVQTNSATSEESAAASEELSGQAQMLKSQIGKFKIKDDNNTNKEIKFNDIGTDINFENENIEYIPAIEF